MEGFCQKLFFFLLFFKFFSLEDKKRCYEDCKSCYEYSEDNLNQKCITCNEDLYLIYNTSNCESMDIHKNYYLNKTDSKLYPCELFKENHCYECDSTLQTKGICLSCIQGYEFNNETNECEKCKENEFRAIHSK